MSEQEAIDALNILLTQKPTTNGRFWQWFRQIADLLMNRFALSYGNEIARITELEFYYHDNPQLLSQNINSIHPDDTSHRNELQKRYAHWYFHHTGTHTHSGYKNLDYNGLDLCFGDSTTTFGILIRAIEIVQPSLPPREQYIYGPSSLLLKRIFPALGILPIRIGKRKIENRPTYLAMMHKIEEGDLFFHDLIRLVPFSFTDPEAIYVAPRIGLNPKKEYSDRPYRFLIRPDKKHLKKGVIRQYMHLYPPYQEQQT